MAKPYQSMDEAELRAALALLERRRDGLGQEEQAVRERINAARAALADKLPDHGGVVGRLPGKTVKTAKLIPFELHQEWPQSLQIEFDDGSMLIAQCDYRVEAYDTVTSENRAARKVERRGTALAPLPAPAKETP